MARLLGIDPGLRFTGWGLIEADGNRLRHIADGVIATDSATSVPDRLRVLHDALAVLLSQHRPDEAAIEETYVNLNGTATLNYSFGPVGGPYVNSSASTGFNNLPPLQNPACTLNIPAGCFPGA